MTREEFTKQLKEEIKNQKVGIDSPNLDDLIDVLYDQHVLLHDMFADFDIEERIRDNLAPDDSIVDTSEEECPHVWKVYNGFTDKYEYCKFCNVRKA